MNKKYIPAVVMLAFLLAGPAAAEEKKQDAAVSEDAVQPAQQAAHGKVLESLTGAGYTYLLIEGEQEKVWVAIPEGRVEVGQEVAVKAGMVMTSFESKALERTFDRIIFSPGLESAGGAVEGGTPKMHGHLDAPMDDAALEALSGGSSRAVVPADELTIEKAKGENAKTVGECFAQAGELDSQTVRIKGKVVKFSPMIMGKNWLHLQDGTGDAMKNTHDLVVTTLDEPAKGSVVVVEGVLHKDKDFGAGYRYAVIIEDAKVIK